jgi:uncharacterized membrane protein YfcA
MELSVLTPEIAVAAVAVVLFSAAVQSATGFGFSVVAVPFMVALLGVRDGVVVNLVLSMAANLAVTVRVRRDAERSIVRPMVVGGLLGLAPGLLLFHWLDLHLLRAGIAAVVTLVALLLLFRVRLPVTERRSLSVATGIGSGLLGGVAGLAGPPLTVYFSGLELGKVSQRATMSVYFTALNLVMVPAHLVTSGSSHVLVWSLLLLPALPFGARMGHWAFARVDELAFQRLVALVVLLAGVAGLVASARP